jgi:hypothetical protein
MISFCYFVPAVIHHIIKIYIFLMLLVLLLLHFLLLNMPQSMMRPGGIRVNCTDVVLSQQLNTLALQTALYCGYAQARCNGTTATNAYAAAFDWTDSSVVTNSVSNRSQADRRGTKQGSGLIQGLRYSPDIYFNDTYGVPGQAPVVYQRIPAVLNMAINSWIKAAFGESKDHEAAVLMYRLYEALPFLCVR